MRDLAIALRRISDRKQNDGHSLQAQKGSTETAADELDVEIAGTWDIIASSKKGKNFKRHDLEEMYRFCLRNRRVKYLLIDFVNRLMREVEVMIYYKVKFNQIGVQLYFCDPAQRHLNSGDQYAKLMLYLEGYKAEVDNDARGETTISRMKTRYSAGYYISHPHAGYMKSDVAGIHIRDPERFELLQKGSRLIIYRQHTPQDAVRWINNHGYRTIGGKRLDVSHYSDFIVDRYYQGKIDIRSEGWPKDVQGLHEPMFSSREHELLIKAVTKRNPRIKLKHNPEFPVANLIRHSECRHEELRSKFSGFWKDRGTRNGRKRPKKQTYRCRSCNKEFSLPRLHNRINDYIGSLEFVPDSATFRRALLKVWRNQRGSAAQRLNALQANRSRLEFDLKETALKYAREPEGAAKNALRLLLEDYDDQLKTLDETIADTRGLELESEVFVRFALKFVEEFKNKWWSLSFDDKKRGELILFNGKFFIDSNANVHTPALSSIYRLGTNKKALSNLDNAHLVELAGSAPASDGVLVSLLQA